VWRNAKQAVARIIGTQAATDAAGAALAAVLADAAAADAARPLAGGTTGLSGGVYFLYACDVVVSAVTKRAAGELPAGTTTDHLTITFAFARVLRLLAGAHAPFLRRYLGVLYQACPYAAPCVTSLGGGGGGGGDATAAVTVAPEQVTQMLSIYAAFLATPPAGPSGVAGGGGTRDASLHGVSHAWRILARVMNAPPHRMAARVLHALLLHCGFALGTAFGVQARALLATLARAYLPALSATPDVEQAHLEIIRQLLFSDVRGGQFDPARVPVLLARPLGSELPLSDDSGRIAS
jgi:hypothetical protein